MSDSVPAWLSSALGEVRPGHAKLAIAKFAEEKMLGRGGFTLTSVAFGHGEPLDPCFTADEEDAVAPPLEWTPPPPGTGELLLLVEDPDAAGEDPMLHWAVWGLPAQKGKILEGEVPPRVGKNAQGNSEWLLPDLETGGKAHDYVFQLFALELPLTLMPGASRKDVLAQIDGNVTGVAVLTGKYASEEGGDYELEEEDGGA